jgi:glycosyltransferase involved in cell wall biosynthesis
MAPQSGASPVTFVLLTFNQESYVAEAVKGALAQSYSPLQIIISDDCSRDRTFDIVRSEVSAYLGPHQVTTRQNETNLGIIAHLNLLMSMVASGLVVIASGDDISFPGRVQHLVDIWAGGDVKVICSNAIVIDKHGAARGPFGRLRSAWLSLPRMIRTGRSGAFGAALAWDRSIFGVFGPLSQSTRNEDKVITFRGALLGRVRYTAAPLLYYREHEDNLSFWARMASASLAGYVALRQEKIDNLVNNYAEWRRLLELSREIRGLTIDYGGAVASLDSRMTLLAVEKQLLTADLQTRVKLFRQSTPKIKDFRQAASLLILACSPKLYAFAMLQGIRASRRIRNMFFTIRRSHPRTQPPATTVTR